MAGMGKRMRPHTLTVPKPLLPIAGKPMVYHIVNELTHNLEEPIEEVCFIIGRFGESAEHQLLEITEGLKIKGKISYQDNPIGTADAILCANNSLNGPVIIVFADTLFKARFSIPPEPDAIIWVYPVKDPSEFGVVKTGESGLITDFVEKPSKFVSNMAITGIYYFRDGKNLRKELQYLKDNNIVKKGEYQLTDALENMKNKGIKFMPHKIDEWLDCGNVHSTIDTNRKILEFNKNILQNTAISENSEIIAPVYLGTGVKITNSSVGPYVSIGENTEVKNSIITNSIIQTNCQVVNANLKDSMIGNFVQFDGGSHPSTEYNISLGDYSNLICR